MKKGVNFIKKKGVHTGHELAERQKRDAGVTFKKGLPGIKEI